MRVDSRTATEADGADATDDAAGSSVTGDALARTLRWLDPADADGSGASLAVKALAKDLARDTAEPIMDRRLRGLVRVDSYNRYLSLLGACERQRSRQRHQQRRTWVLGALCVALSLALPAVALLA